MRVSNLEGTILEPYPEYRDSNLQALDEIPSHWQQKRLKYLASINETSLPETTNPGYEFRYIDIGSVATGRLTKPPMRERFGTAPSRARRVLRKGDTIISTVRTYLKAIYHIGRDEADLVASTGFAVLTPRREAHPEYLSFVVRSNWFVDLVTANSVGTAYPAISESVLGNFQIPLPRIIDEQQMAVNFLAHIDRRINRLIHAKRRHIELLNEQKLGIINQAVTRGLDPNVRLKPSGIEWLGDVPEHWEVKRLKNLVSRVTSGSRGWSSYAADNGVLFIRIANLTRASIGLDMANIVRLQLPDAVMGEADRTRVKGGDILVSITAFIGSVALVPTDIEEAYVSQHVACCRPISSAANKKWVTYVLLSSVGQMHGHLRMYGGTKQGLSLDDVRNYIIPLPPTEEQSLLVHWIETATSSVDTALTVARREIDLLREYHTRLIADVVTGKLDVRGVELPEIDNDDELEYLDVEDAAELDDLAKSLEDPDDDE